jgi:hypothetical protein
MQLSLQENGFPATAGCGEAKVGHGDISLEQGDTWKTPSIQDLPEARSETLWKFSMAVSSR